MTSDCVIATMIRFGDGTERAYRRGDALQKRRELMQAWASYLTRESSDKVVPFPAGQKRT